jgi:hypothetical protein
MTDTDPWLPQDPPNLLDADPGRREPISFESDGNQLAAHLYRPPRAAPDEVTPGIVMTGAVSSVRSKRFPTTRSASPTPATPSWPSTRAGSARARASRDSTTTRG